jgi:enoyl-CoA hydratase
LWWGEADYLDMTVAPNQVKAAALATTVQLAMLPATSYAWNKNAVSKATLDRIRASLGIHHKL